MTDPTRKLQPINEMGFPLDEAAYFTGIDETQFRNWLARNKLLAGGGSGHGRRRIYSFADLFDMRAVRALVEDANLRSTVAAAAVNPHRIVRWLFSGELFWLRKDPAGEWTGEDGPRTRVRLVIDPMELYREMRPRFAKRYPAESAEFERRLDDLLHREKPAIDALAARQRRDHAELDELLLQQRSPSDDLGERYRRERDAKRELRERHQREEADLRERLQRERGGDG